MKPLFFATILSVFSLPVFATQANNHLHLIPIDSCRVFDSRPDGAPKIPFNHSYQQQVAFNLTNCVVGVHTQERVRAVHVTYTIVAPDADGHLKTWGTDRGGTNWVLPPSGTTLTFIAGQTISTTTVTKVTSGFPGPINTLNGRIFFYAFAHTPGGYHLVIDVVGIYVE